MFIAIHVLFYYYLLFINFILFYKMINLNITLFIYIIFFEAMYEMDCWCSWLSHFVNTEKVAGSSPAWFIYFLLFCQYFGKITVQRSYTRSYFCVFVWHFGISFHYYFVIILLNNSSVNRNMKGLMKVFVVTMACSVMCK
jgi:hypothetical protein